MKDADSLTKGEGEGQDETSSIFYTNKPQVAFFTEGHKFSHAKQTLPRETGQIKEIETCVSVLEGRVGVLEGSSPHTGRQRSCSSPITSMYKSH